MPAAVALAARTLVAVVLLTAALAKLADRPGTKEAVVGFGLPEALAPGVAALLPLVEFLTASLLLPGTTAVAGAIASLGLLAVFSVAISVSLARGRAPECHCFGQLRSAPAGPKALARNGLLVALAVVALFPRRQLSAVDWVGHLDAVGTVALVGGLAVALLLGSGTLAFVSLLRSYGRALVRLERVERLLEAREPSSGKEVMVRSGLRPGAPAPLPDPLAGLLAAGQPVLLLFMSPHCSPCRALLPKVASWQREHAGTLTFALAVQGERDEVVPFRDELGADVVIEDEGLDLYNAFRASGTPGAVLVASDGTVASWVASGGDEIEELVAETVSRHAGLPIGASAPVLQLVDLEGGPAVLTDVLVRPTVLVFWNPSCGFCRAMHHDLLALDQSSDSESAGLLIVSSGEADATRAEGFRSALLDPQSRVASAFAARGTPMAVRLDTGGRVASLVVAGAEAVLALARALLPSVASDNRTVAAGSLR